jgi:hypothetical protein
MSQQGGLLLPKKRQRRNVDTKTSISCTECFRRRKRCGAKRPCAACLRRGCAYLCVDRSDSQTSSREYTKRVKIADTSAIVAVPANSELGPVIFLNAEESEKHLNRIRDQDVRSSDRFQLVMDLVHSRRTGPLNVFGNGFPNQLQLPEDIYYSSIWHESPSEDWRPLIHYYHKDCSSEFLADMLLKNPITWRVFQSLILGTLGLGNATSFQKEVTQKAMRSSDINEVDKQLIQGKSNFVPFEHHKASIALNCRSDLKAGDEEEEEIIKSIFNVQTLENSDIAILKTWDFLEPNGMHFNALIECNPVFEALIGVSLMEIAQLLSALRGLRFIGAIFWGLEKRFWTKLFKFIIGSLFKRPVWMTEIVDIRNRTGESIPCLGHIFASYDKTSGVRTCITFCWKPLSPTFCLKLN